MTTTLLLFSAALAAAAAFMLIFYVANALVHELTPPDEKAKRAAAAASPRPYYWTKLAQRIEKHLPERAKAQLRKSITMAGGLKELTPADMSLAAVLALFGSLTAGILVVLMTGWSGWLVLLVSIIGAFLPLLWLRDQVKKRHLAILTDLSFHLDLLTLSVEAGLDFGAAVARMVDKGRPGALRDEFATFLGELRIGKTRAEALQTMSDRVGLPALSNFLGALVQADRLGTGLGKTLRLQSEQLRNERFQRAEKAAGEAPVKMLIPLVMFIFPTIWIILAGPLVFEWIFKGSP